MKEMLRTGRIDQKLTTAEVSRTLKIDAALISKFESGQRNPTRLQLQLLADLYQIDFHQLLLLWLKNKILQIVEGEDLAQKAIESALNELSGASTTNDVPASFQKLMEEMQTLKGMLASGKQNP
jgi:transcriptional regulator with XRE-family HTH domain